MVTKCKICECQLKLHRHLQKQICMPSMENLSGHRYKKQATKWNMFNCHLTVHVFKQGIHK